MTRRELKNDKYIYYVVIKTYNNGGTYEELLPVAISSFDEAFKTLTYAYKRLKKWYPTFVKVRRCNTVKSLMLSDKNSDTTKILYILRHPLLDKHNGRNALISEAIDRTRTTPEYPDFMIVRID